MKIIQSFRRGSALLWCVFLYQLCKPSIAVAHPHMALEARLDFVFEGKQCIGVWMDWTFDAMFSVAIIGEYDTNRDGRFDARENSRVFQGAFSNLKNYGYFIYIRKSDTRSNPKGVEQFQAFQRQNRLAYRFFVPLSSLNGGTEFSLAVFDSTFYCAVQYAKDGIRCIDRAGNVLPRAPEGPSIQQLVNKKYPIYYNPRGAANDFRVYQKWEKGLETAYPEEIIIRWE
ncbi:MAG: DUF1007 family protein [Treponemataceae bacterium]|nr:DUF1007 family protein [Treponemataceae bacterium]